MHHLAVMLLLCTHFIPVGNHEMYKHVWQSQVKIKHYFVAHFNHITAFEAL